MRVLHVPFCYYPDQAGGTEVYVESLARYQRESGMEPAIAAPAPEDGAHVHDGSPVYRIGVSKALTLRQMYGEGDPKAARAFIRLLEQVRPDVLHLHAFTPAISMLVVRRARETGIPIVFTYHMPAATCSQGTLLRWGAEPCDGKMRHRACAACVMHAKGAPKISSQVLGTIPASVGGYLGACGLEGAMWTALRATELLKLRHGAARELFAAADVVVAVCEWARRVLILNGVEPEKIVLCRQGLGADARKPADERRRAPGEPTRIAFMGRVHPVKGLPVLIEALRLIPDLPLTLDVYAVAQKASHIQLRQELIEQSKGDQRIRFQTPLPAERVVDTLRECDALAVPSQWMETGPLVAYEAFAAGTPVIGSNLGGIAELVRHDVNGLLVEPKSRIEWAKGLKRLCEEPGLIDTLRRGIGPVRTMRNVAAEMQAVYGRVMQPAAQALS